jgi:tetratricopeptide (TPR) repeat protein
MTTASEPRGSIDTALKNARQLLTQRPDLAGEQAREVLKAAPAHPTARLILGASLRLSRKPDEAAAVLAPLCEEQPQWVPPLLEYSLTLNDLNSPLKAISILKRAVAVKPDSADAWRLLAEQLDIAGTSAEADAARAQYLRAANRDPKLLEAASALVANDLPKADRLLRRHLDAHGSDIAALRMLAEVAGRLRLYREAESLLTRCLELSPSFDAARHNLSTVLNRQGRPAEALEQLGILLKKDPKSPAYLNSKAAALANLGDYDAAIDCYESVLNAAPRQPKIWMSFGHTLRTAGRQTESIEAYRRAIAMEPTLGEAWWSLANLKTFKFSNEDMGALESALKTESLSSEDRLHFEFAMGKALEDRNSFEQSFCHYMSGNAIRHKLRPYNAAVNTAFVRRSREVFTPGFFAERTGGAPASDPIFIVGLPRAGSTLIEQILASHSEVEGTIELPDLPQLARELSRSEQSEEPGRFFAAVSALDAGERQALGRRYLESTRVHRKSNRRFFIDKMPNNFNYVGLIQLILPNAKIIDARRHPLACCFSNVKQHFAQGQDFSYSLDDIGRYYRDYVALMAHFDEVLPGRMHRVLYEAMIDDTETQVSRLLDFCGLPFEGACLRFYENDRPVRTASSEQVRQPIFRDGIDQWRHFEPWLDPLKQALGPVLPSYPEVPRGDFLSS